jgi:hypothetical protein
MNNKNLLLGLASVLIVLGLFKPDLSQFINTNNSNTTNSVIVIEKPTNVEILDECEAVIGALKANKDRKTDGVRLASLYNDMSTLVGLDGEDVVIKNTEEIRQANKLVGAMLKLDIKGKYPKLAQAAEKLVVSSIGDDSVMLDTKLREQAAEGFKALAWSCQEGAK